MSPLTSSQTYRQLPILVLVIALVTLVVGAISLSVVERRLLATSGEALSLAAADIADKLDLVLYERFSAMPAMAEAHGKGTLMVSAKLSAISHRLSASEEKPSAISSCGKIDRSQNPERRRCANGDKCRARHDIIIIKLPVVEKPLVSSDPQVSGSAQA